MPVYSPQAMADKTRYLINQGLPQAEAEAKAFAELGIYGDLPQDVRSAYDHYMTNPSTQSPFARNDRDQILDRANAGANVNDADGRNTVDASPQYTTNPADFNINTNTEGTGTTASPEGGTNQ
jgi:hypothetical protein